MSREEVHKVLGPELRARLLRRFSTLLTSDLDSEGLWNMLEEKSGIRKTSIRRVDAVKSFVYLEVDSLRSEAQLAQAEFVDGFLSK